MYVIGGISTQYVKVTTKRSLSKEDATGCKRWSIFTGVRQLLLASLSLALYAMSLILLSAVE